MKPDCDSPFREKKKNIKLSDSLLEHFSSDSPLPYTRTFAKNFLPVIKDLLFDEMTF